MTWVRLDDLFAEHPKVSQLSDAAFRLHVTAMCYSGRLLTDGFVPGNMILRLTGTPEPSAMVDELLASRCWELVEGGYHIHDFLNYNPSAEQVRQGRDENARRQAEFRLRRKERRQIKSDAVSNGVSNALVTVYPYPGPVVTKVTTDEERTAHADAPVKVKQPAKPKTPGLSHAPIHDAFDAAGRDRPLIESKKERDAAQFILKHFSDHISAIPECFDDVATGHYGGSYERRKLSLHLIANDNFLQNYLRWKQDGKPTESAQPRASPNSRPSSQVYDPPRSEVPEWTLPASAKKSITP